MVYNKNLTTELQEQCLHSGLAEVIRVDYVTIWTLALLKR